MPATEKSFNFLGDHIVEFSKGNEIIKKYNRQLQ